MTWTDKLLTNNYIEFKPFEWLEIKSIIGCDYSVQNGWYYNPIFYIDAPIKMILMDLEIIITSGFLGIGKNIK